MPNSLHTRGAPGALVFSSNVSPHRSLDDDLKITDQSMSYDGSATQRATVGLRNNPLASSRPSEGANQNVRPDNPNDSTLSKVAAETAVDRDWPVLSDGKPDFDAMNAAQRVAYHDWRLKRTFG